LLRLHPREITVNSHCPYVSSFATTREIYVRTINFDATITMEELETALVMLLGIVAIAAGHCLGDMSTLPNNWRHPPPRLLLKKEGG
jgi:hypothetical protein